MIPLKASLVGVLVLMFACEGRDPNVPEPPQYDPRAITRCEHGVDDKQSGYTLQQWKACFNAARAYSGEQPKAALDFARRSCDLGFADGCIQYLDFVHSMGSRERALSAASRHGDHEGEDAAKEHLPHARELGVKFCREGLFTLEGREFQSGEACHLAGLLHQDVEPVDLEVAKEMFEMGCTRKDDRSCGFVQRL